MICLYPIQMTYTYRRELIKHEVCPDILSSRTRLFRTKYFAYNIMRIQLLFKLLLSRRASFYLFFAVVFKYMWTR